MNMTIIKRCLTLLLTLGLTFIFTTTALADVKTREKDKKESTKNDFKVTFTPDKETYAPNENITFSFHSNKTCYVYLFAINEENDRGHVLLPNKLQKDVKYTANKTFTIPEKGVEFYSDAPGTERIVVLASLKKLNVNFGKEYDQAGTFLTTSQNTLSKDIKALVVRARSDKNQQVMRKIDLVISDDEAEEQPIKEKKDVAKPFISTDKLEYNIDDEMTITYGADKKGFLYIYIIEPNNKETLLKKVEIDADKVSRVQAQITKPIGSHTLLAVYSENGDVKKKDLTGITAASTSSKGVQLIDTDLPPHVAHRFEVKQ